MDAKAINEKSKELQKAVQANAQPAVIIGLLNELKKGVVATEEILRSTKVGVTVNKIKSSPNRDVGALAGSIVRKWREEVEAKRDANGAGSNNKRNSSSVKSPSGTASPAPPPTSQQEKKMPNVPLDQRTSKTDKVDVRPTGNATRDNCAGLLYNGLAYMSPDPSKAVLAAATAVEARIYKTLGPDDKDSYKEKVRSLFQNLKNKANASLRARVLSGDISPERLVGMSHEELKSAERRAEDRKLEAENMRDAQAPVEEKSISTSLQCGKCHQKKVSYSQAQTRSADEPMTTFCECLVCGKRWKFS